MLVLQRVASSGACTTLHLQKYIHHIDSVMFSSCFLVETFLLTKLFMIHEMSLSHSGSMGSIFARFINHYRLPCIDCCANVTVSNSHIGLAVFAEDRTCVIITYWFLMTEIDNKICKCLRVICMELNKYYYKIYIE